VNGLKSVNGLESVNQTEKREPAQILYSDDASGFVLLADAVPQIVQEMRYFTTFNCTGARVDGYEEPAALLTREAAEALRRAAEEAESKGFRLRIFDAYRPVRAVKCFERWEKTADERMKPFFFPEITKADIFAESYIARLSSHSRGSTIDLTLLDMATGLDLDMGSPFDRFDDSSNTFSERVTQEQHDNRMRLRALMERAGFRPVQSEWWHFTLKDEPYPDTYFDFPVCRAAVGR
jgi:D-alanyl-D-alanine dipeptidase